MSGLHRVEGIGPTMDVVNQFHRWLRKDTEIRDRPYREPISMAICKDGFMVSIQASEYSYCTPRVTEDCEYSAFELGFPSMDVPELSEWKDGEGDDKQTVYAYVPTPVIAALLEKHGGLIGALMHFKPEKPQVPQADEDRLT